MLLTCFFLTDFWLWECRWHLYTVASTLSQTGWSFLTGKDQTKPSVCWFRWKRETLRFQKQCRANEEWRVLYMSLSLIVWLLHTFLNLFLKNETTELNSATGPHRGRLSSSVQTPKEREVHFSMAPCLSRTAFPSLSDPLSWLQFLKKLLKTLFYRLMFRFELVDQLPPGFICLSFASIFFVFYTVF